jgi:hypothetical protein
MKKLMFIVFMTALFSASFYLWEKRKENPVVASVWRAMFSEDPPWIDSYNMEPPKRADHLFTVFLQIPIHDMIPKDIEWDKQTHEPSEDILGLCWRNYEVGIGYKNLLKLFDIYYKDACFGNIEKMPDPEIISSNAKESQIHGEYLQSQCDNFDLQNKDHQRESHKYVMRYLKDYEQWENISRRSKEILQSYFKIFCENPQNNKKTTQVEVIK